MYMCVAETGIEAYLGVRAHEKVSPIEAGRLLRHEAVNDLSCECRPGQRARKYPLCAHIGINSVRSDHEIVVRPRAVAAGHLDLLGPLHQLREGHSEAGRSFQLQGFCSRESDAAAAA